MSEDFIPTKGSSAKSDTSIHYQSVVFESYKPKRKDEQFSVSLNDSKEEKLNEFNIKRAKNEVVKYGMSGFDPQKKEEAKMQLAIKLGAKPLKNKYINYKLMKEERAKHKAEEKQKSQFQQLGKNSTGKSIAKSKGFDRKHRKNKNGLLDLYGRVKTVDKDK